MCPQEGHGVGPPLERVTCGHLGLADHVNLRRHGLDCANGIMPRGRVAVLAVRALSLRSFRSLRTSQTIGPARAPALPGPVDHANRGMAWSVLCQLDHPETQGRGGGSACTLRQVCANVVNDWAGGGAGAPRTRAGRPFTFDRPGILTPWQCRPVLPTPPLRYSPGNWCPSPVR